MPTLRFDEGFRGLCPRLSDDERAKLMESIREEGVRDGVVYWDNGERHPPILDGNNRAEICAELGFTYPCVGMKFASRREAECWILRNQLGRRNLNEIQRAVLLKHLADTISCAKANGVGHTPSSREVTMTSLNQGDVNPTLRADRRLTAAVAREAEVSESTVKRGLQTEAALRDLEAKAPAIANEALAGALHGKQVVELAKLGAEQLQPLAGLKGRELRKNAHLLLHHRMLLFPLGEEFHNLRQAVAKCKKLALACKKARGGRGHAHWSAINDCLDKISWEIREWSRETAEHN
jgi:hypothetical protein